MNEKINQEHGKFINAAEVRFVRLLPGPIERAWQYLVDPEKRRLWFCGGTAAGKVGEPMTLVFNNKELAFPHEVVPEKYQPHAKEGITFDVTVTRCEPPNVLQFTWDESDVRFELEPKGEKVQLTLTHNKLPNRKDLLDVSGGWHIHLTVLVAKLEGSVQPPFWSTLERLEQEYDRLIPGTASASA